MPAVVVTEFDIFRKTFVNGAGYDMEYASSPVGAHLRALVYRTGTPNRAADLTLSNIPNVEVVGTNYTAGGVALANGTLTLNGSNAWDLDFDDPGVFAQHVSGFADARRIVFAWDNGGAQATWNVIAFSADFGADKGNVDGPFSIEIATAGFLTLPRS